MKHTAVPLAPRLEECLVTLDARRMVDLGATPGGRNGDDEQAGSISNPSIPRQKERENPARNCGGNTCGGAGRESRRPPPPRRGAAVNREVGESAARSTHLRSQTTRLPPSKQMKQTTSSSSSLRLAGRAGTTAPAPSFLLGGLPRFRFCASGGGGGGAAASPMIELRNCGSSVPAAGGGARRRSSGGQSGSSGAGDALPAPSGAAASMDRQGFRASGQGAVVVVEHEGGGGAGRGARARSSSSSAAAVVIPGAVGRRLAETRAMTTRPVTRACCPVLRKASELRLLPLRRMGLGRCRCERTRLRARQRTRGDGDASRRPGGVVVRCGS
jgi:hypothetical protein